MGTGRSVVLFQGALRISRAEPWSLATSPMWPICPLYRDQILDVMDGPERFWQNQVNRYDVNHSGLVRRRTCN